MFLVVVSYIKRRRSVRILSTTSARSTSSGGAKGRSFLTNHSPILYNRSWLMLFWLGEQYWSIYKVNIFEFRPTWNLLGLMTEVNEAKKWKFKYSPHKLAIRISKKLGGTEQSRPKPRYRNGRNEENIVQNRERINLLLLKRRKSTLPTSLPAASPKIKHRHAKRARVIFLW